MKHFLVMVIFQTVLENSVLVRTLASSGATLCTKKEDQICSRRSAEYCKYANFRYQCPRKCKECVDKPAVPKHLVTVYEARSAMSEVVQDIISSSILTPNSTMEKINLNEVNEVMYQIERSMGQADLSRKEYKIPELKTDIKKGIELGNVKFARRALAKALHTIGKSSSTTASRGRRSIKFDAKRFLEVLKTELGEKKFSKLVALKGGKTLMFAIDITGSMHDEIEAAKLIAINISNTRREPPPRDYMLSWFGDPEDMGDFIHKDGEHVNEFIKKIDSLRAYGGGDCSEFAFQGMFAAIEENAPELGSPLFVFTDASPKDGTHFNKDMLVELANENKVHINFFTAEACENPPEMTFDTFKTLASDTGGLYLPISKIKMKSMASFTGTALESLATVKSGDTVSKKRKRRSTIDEISIPLDNTITQLVISTTTEKKANGVSLRAPSGLEWTEGLNRLDNAAIYIVDLPADGEWKLQVPVDAGDYKYSVKVSSAENINFNHHYTKKVNGKTLEFKSPLAGEAAQIELKIAGAKQIQKDSLQVDIVDVHGKVLIRDLKPNPFDDDGSQYGLAFNPPKDKFKILIKGKTKMDKVFQRVSQQTSQAKPLVLKEFYTSGDSIKQGGSAYIMLYLFNGMDSNQKFRISFRDTLGYKVTLLGSRRLTVRAKSKKFLRVAVKYSGGRLGKEGQDENVIILVKSSLGASTTAIVTWMVKK